MKLDKFVLLEVLLTTLFVSRLIWIPMEHCLEKNSICSTGELLEKKYRYRQTGRQTGRQAVVVVVVVAVEVVVVVVVLFLPKS